jgi:hypothetical protein
VFVVERRRFEAQLADDPRTAKRDVTPMFKLRVTDVADRRPHRDDASPGGGGMLLLLLLLLLI